MTTTTANLNLRTGPTIKKGTKVKTSHVVSDVGESADLTAVLVDGSRIPIREVLV